MTKQTNQTHPRLSPRGQRILSCLRTIVQEIEARKEWERREKRRDEFNCILRVICESKREEN